MEMNKNASEKSENLLRLFFPSKVVVNPHVDCMSLMRVLLSLLFSHRSTRVPAVSLACVRAS